MGSAAARPQDVAVASGVRPFPPSADAAHGAGPASACARVFEMGETP
jgi:hypothetical protein